MTWRQLFLYIALGLLIGVAITAVIWIVFIPYNSVDILITNGTVIDGTGGPSRVVDIGIREGKIVELSSWRYLLTKAETHIDASGLVVAPGFIDVHTHVEANIPAAGPFRADNFLRQGVTTIITGNCGRSRTNIAELFQKLEQNGSYLNVASLVGHNSVRQQVMGVASRPPTSEELEAMKNLIDRAMRDGAVGFSSGLVYVPGRFATTSEVVALATVAGTHGALYASHIRDEGPQGIEAIREALEVGRASGAATQISHFKSAGPRQWGTMAQRLALLDDARRQGQKVGVDFYPYARSSTTTDVLLPDWALKDNRAGLREVARSATVRRKLHDEIIFDLTANGWKDLTFVKLAAGPKEWIGKTLAEAPVIALSLPQQVENLIEVSLRGGAQAVYADMDDQDVAAVAAYPYCVFGSDSAVRDPTVDYLPHPRGCGTFPRVFRRYVIEQGALSIENAVHKASGQAAEMFRLSDRGFLRPGYWADLVLFDPNKIEDRADYDQPFAQPLGIDYVIVNGVIAVDHGNLTSNRPGGMPVRRGNH